MAECSLVNESKVGARVVKGEPGPQVGAKRRIGVADQQLPAHAEMSKQRVVANRQPQILSATPDVTNLTAGQRGGEVFRTSQMPARGTRMKHLDVGEPARADMPLQSEPDALHLWQLWHRRPLSILAKPGAACWFAPGPRPLYLSRRHRPRWARSRRQSRPRHRHQLRQRAWPGLLPRHSGSR